jgi:hypothetical protein
MSIRDDERQAVKDAIRDLEEREASLQPMIEAHQAAKQRAASIMRPIVERMTDEHRAAWACLIDAPTQYPDTSFFRHAVLGLLQDDRLSPNKH